MLSKAIPAANSADVARTRGVLPVPDCPCAGIAGYRSQCVKIQRKQNQNLIRIAATKAVAPLSSPMSSQHIFHHGMIEEGLDRVACLQISLAREMYLAVQTRRLKIDEDCLSQMAHAMYL